ncbi:helix-turn-helix transcriptional regulator [Limnochorda pilosa]|uniref:Transcription regulator PadR N-terminal domain-containing protein n=1 Tax=Limnochorda pilosa TaxID=1555112 RepID=A0A0K2SGG7_LIMPI|nr:helix-turn-helix transcriptional regulator [Limnochorda pilosa]BAS26137.1 hypothetical protein LIP_0280 [Limnochorda pilosa]
MRLLTRLLILWLLSERPLHGYRIKQILDEEGLRFWFPVEVGSLYSVLRTLEREGHVRVVGVEREGRRPQRTQFAITPEGRRHFQMLLQEAWISPPKKGDPFQLALAAPSELGDEVVRRLAQTRLTMLEQRLATIQARSRSAPAAAVAGREAVLTEAEFRWLEEWIRSQGGDQDGGDRAVPKSRPEVQLIANLVVHDAESRILLVRYDPDDERWWLPGADLEPYQHPDQAAREVLAAFPGLRPEVLSMSFVDSFRGRRGWHVVFNYGVSAEGEPGGAYPAGWFSVAELPRTVHGAWEKEVIRRIVPS